jgi:replicative DNA helicase Mcm
MTQNKLIDLAEDYLAQYERDSILSLASNYPQETRSLVIDWRDIYQWDPDFADDLLSHPSKVIPALEDAVNLVDLPTGITLDAVNVRVITPDDARVSAGRVAERDGGQYVGVTGVLSQAGKRVERLDVGVYICQRCGEDTSVPQDPERPQDAERQDPHQCSSCQRQGPFKLDADRSEWTDYRLIRVSQPPGEGAPGEQLAVDAYVEDDMVNVDCDVRRGEGEPLSHRAGERVVVHGILERVPESKDSLTYDYVLDGRYVTFTSTQAEVADMADDRITENARAIDSSQRFRESMSPGTYRTDNWELVFKVAEAFLFAAPTINIDGEGKRGSIHFAIFGDPGLNKSQFMQSLRKISLDSAYVSASGKQVSEVGFTAAAIEDDFGGGGFTLKPGVLPRAGWHAFIDEIDKFGGDVTSLNDALEFPQTITVEKAGIRATLDTTCGVMVMGNPKGGRFSPEADPWQEIRAVVDPSLLSRFDAVIPLRDVPDEKTDTEIADHIVSHHREQAQRAKGELSESDLDVSDREIPLEVLRAWLKKARDYQPLLTDDAHDRLVSFFPDGRGDGEGRRPNYTFRKLDAGIRFAKAFARRDLSEEATVAHAEEAIDVLKPLIGLTHEEGEGLNPDVLQGNGWGGEPSTQEERVMSITELCREEARTFEELVEESGISESKLEHEVEKLKDRGELYEPSQGEYKTL